MGVAAPPRPFPSSRPLRMAFVVAVGLGVGILTSFGQQYLDGTLNPLVNSASAWLVAPFAAGACMATRRGAVAAGLSVCLLQLLGYYVTAHLRGYPAGDAILAFWVACGLLGGPVFGAAGHAWRAIPRLRGLGAAVLAGAFIAEGLWVYAHELHRDGSAALWLAIGIAVAVAMAPPLSTARWLALTIPAGIAAELVLTQVYLQSF